MARWGIYNVDVWNAVLSLVAPSTRISYQSIFLKFVKFVEDEGLNFRSMSIANVLLFLKSFSGLLKSRVRTGVAALKFFLKVYNRIDLVENPLLDMFSKGAQNMAPLPAAKTLIWDPNKVLESLKAKPRPSLFLVCARETVLLLLLTTGWRVDDVSKLSNEVSFDLNMVTFRSAEKRKCPIIKGKHTVTQSVKSFLVCPPICPVLEAV
jgi:hypothetical protein